MIWTVNLDEYFLIPCLKSELSQHKKNIHEEI